MRICQSSKTNDAGVLLDGIAIGKSSRTSLDITFFRKLRVSALAIILLYLYFVLSPLRCQEDWMSWDLAPYVVVNISRVLVLGTDDQIEATFTRNPAIITTMVRGSSYDRWARARSKRGHRNNETHEQRTRLSRSGNPIGCSLKARNGLVRHQRLENVDETRIVQSFGSGYATLHRRSIGNPWHELPYQHNRRKERPTTTFPYRG